MSWQEQYRQVLRSLNRIQDRNKSAEDYVDELSHFFMDCWHLKDWIRYDAGLPPKVKAAITSAAKKKPFLQLCADVANGRKHLELDPKRSFRRAVLIGEIELRSGAARVEYVIVDKKGGGRRLLALDIAKRAVNQWGRIITGQGLTLPRL